MSRIPTSPAGWEMVDFTVSNGCGMHRCIKTCQNRCSPTGRTSDIGVGGSEELSKRAEEHGTPEKCVRLLEWSEKQVVCACQVAAQTPDALSQCGAQTFAMLNIVLGIGRCSWLEVARW